MIKLANLPRAIAASALTLASLSLFVLACQESGPTDLTRSGDGSLTPAAPSWCSDNPSHPACDEDDGGDDGGGTEPTAVVTITTSIAGAGLYGDGGGTYAGTFDNSPDLWVSPPCPREFLLDLTGEGLVPPFDEVIADCDFPPRLTIEGLLGAGEGDILGSSVPPGSTNMGAATNYYFEDSEGRTFNVIWQAGIRVTGVSDPVDNGDGTTTTTYTLSTDPDLADDADLVTRAVKGRPRTEPVCRVGEIDGDPLSDPECDGNVVTHLELTVEVIQ